MNNSNHNHTNDHIDLSVIIVNYKSWSHLENCLMSLKTIQQDDFTFEIIVVDNLSNDNRFDEFSKKFNSVNFILNSGNYGFSHANNAGAKAAKGKFFLFLNPDTIVNKHALLTMLELAKNNSNYGIISCSKLRPDGNPEKEIRFFPKLSTLFGISRAIYELVNKQKISEKFDNKKDIIFPDWVSGSIIFISRKWFENVSGWNEDYWLYLEDVDLCKKVNNAGGKIALTRNVNIIHNHGGASRINIKTAALTKAQVIISKHVYIQNHFKNSLKIVTQFLLLLFILIAKFIFALLGLIFFFVPKLYLNVLLFIDLIKYYFKVLLKRTWVSERAPNYANASRMFQK